MSASPSPRLVEPDWTLRLERREDHEGVHGLHVHAFPSPAEAELVTRLRERKELLLSLVAERDGEVVGHVAFSPVVLPGGQGGVGLAPVAVAEHARRQGIAAALIHDGIGRLQGRGFGFVVVLGDPRYYGRFGFRPAQRFALRDAYEGGEAFQALVLRTGSLPSEGGLVRYASAFDALGTSPEHA